jgi:hypothetical protein
MGELCEKAQLQLPRNAEMARKLYQPTSCRSVLRTLVKCGEGGLERVCELCSIGNEGIGQAHKRRATGRGMFPIHDEPAEAIMPRMRALHLPAPGLPSRMNQALRGPAPFGRDMPDIAFLPDHGPRRGIVKRGSQTQMVRVVGIRPGTHTRQRGEYRGQHGAVVDIRRREDRTEWHPPPIDQ